MMKRLMLFFALALVFLTTFATSQEGDIIYIDGTKWILLGNPVFADSILRRDLEDSLPENRGIRTSNWDGYTAYWSIQQEPERAGGEDQGE